MHWLVPAWATPSAPPSLLLMLLIGNMLMRFVTIADSLWTFYFVTGWVKSQRYRAGGFLPQAHGPSSTICRTSFHLNNKWLPSSFFSALCYTEALRLLTCFCGLRKETATSHDEELLSLTVKPCPGSTGYTIPLTAMNPAAAQRIYCAIQSWNVFV